MVMISAECNARGPLALCNFL